MIRRRSLSVLFEIFISLPLFNRHRMERAQITHYLWQILYQIQLGYEPACAIPRTSAGHHSPNACSRDHVHACDAPIPSVDPRTQSGRLSWRGKIGRAGSGCRSSRTQTQRGDGMASHTHKRDRVRAHSDPQALRW